MSKQDYAEKLRDPRWQKLRLQVFERDGWCCQNCGSSKKTLCVHHRVYLQQKDPWEYPVELLIALCDDCHTEETEQMARQLDSLSYICKLRLLSPQVCELACALLVSKFQDTEDNVINMLCWILRDEKMQQELIPRYLDDDAGLERRTEIERMARLQNEA